MGGKNIDHPHLGRGKTYIDTVLPLQTKAIGGQWVLITILMGETIPQENLLSIN
jgi:hypothetical protein